MTQVELPLEGLHVPALTIHRAASVEALAVVLASRMATDPPADPMQPVPIAVPSRGMERWLTQRLATDLGAVPGEAGICANVRFPFLGSIVHDVLAAVLGEDPSVPDPWTPQRLAWPLLELLSQLSEDAVNAPLLAHLSEAGEQTARRRFPLARRIADLFDRYAMYRPDMVRAWSEGGSVDPRGDALPDNLAWQPPLWRAVVDRLGTPSLDDRFRRAIAALDDGDVARPGDLPDAVTIFGVVSLPPLHLELLAALAPHAEVSIHAVAPCSAWPPGRSPGERRNPLLLSSGTSALHAHAAFAEHELPLAGASAPPSGEVGGDALVAAGASALAVLQADVRADRRRGVRGAAPVRLRDGDRSVQVHACHGPMRQLEVLREVLFGLLEEDPTLEPRDIVVLSPDIETFAPIVTAVFLEGDRSGDRAVPGGSGTGLPALPFRVADRTVRDENAVAQVLLAVLELVTARVGASAVVDLLASAPVSARFEFTPADIAQLPAWVLGTGTTWGMDADHRSRLIGLDDPAHTWDAGLDRLVLGAAMADDGTRMVDGVVPYDDVEGSRVDLLGRLQCATDALFTCLRSLEEARPVSAWRDALEATLDALCDPGSGARRDAELAWELASVREALTSMVEDSAGPDGSPSPVELSLEEVRGALGSHLGQRTGSAQYGSGAITFAGMIPLRNVPHRVVCLVGMDDGALPRSSHQHGFDLVATHPLDGDPDPRFEDRQSMLDAILSAREHLVVTYTGHDPRTNERQQPAVPVSELLDALRASFTIGEDGATPPVERFLISHPLQPHSPRYFRSAAPGELPVPPAFDLRQLTAARAAVGERRPILDLFAEPLPDPREELLDPVVIELSDLVRFLEHPIRHLLQRRLGLWLGEEDRRLVDRDPTELDGLERWQLGQHLLTRRRDGSEVPGWRELTLACGNVPVGGLGEVALDGIEELVDAMCDGLAAIPGDRRSVTIDVPIRGHGGAGRHGPQRRLVGSVDLVGSTVAFATVSKLKAKHRIRTWLEVLAVLAAGAGPATGRLFGRDPTLAAGYREIRLDPYGSGTDEDVPDLSELAATRLSELVALYLRGHEEPVPLMPQAAYEFARCRAGGKELAAAMQVAADVWEGNDWHPGEQADAYVVQAFGSSSDLEGLARRFTFTDDAELVWLPIIAAELGS
jgi:exodeoxyribonuclease V gamma subunit